MLVPLLLSILVQAAVPAVEGRRIAILIGNGAYAQTPQGNAAREAAQMQTAFASLGFEATLFANTGSNEFNLAVHEWTRGITPLDTIVVYFQGYVMRTEGDNYLLPIDFKAATMEEAKQKAYSAAVLLREMKAAKAAVLILDPAGDQPFDIGRDRPAGLTALKAKDNTFVAFASSPGKAPSKSEDAEAGTFGRVLRETLLQQPGAGLAELLASVRAKVKEASAGRQVPWTSSGSSAVSGLVLHDPSRKTMAKREETLDQIRGQRRRLDIVQERRMLRASNLRQFAAPLDAEYGPLRAAAAKKTEKGEFETTPQYLARTTEARAEAAALEDRYKKEHAKLEAVFSDTTGDPDVKSLESTKARRFHGPCEAEWVLYDADTEMLTLAVGGMDRIFQIPVPDARNFKPRASRLICEGGFTPESVAVRDPAGVLALAEVPWKALRANSQGVTPPRIVTHVNPEYSELARKARFQGTIVLKLLVDENGAPRAIQVVRPLGMGLDEKAVQAVRRWRFHPGMKDGKAIVTEADVEVSFRLL